MTVLFLHPDLGIGGAERAIVDAAMAAKSIGYDVEIITNYHDHSHCFEETANGTLKVTPVFQWLPRTTFGKITAVWAFVKMVLAAIWICLFRRSQAELIFVDQVSAPLPILRLFGFKVATVFYGHFPDMLLASHASTMRRAYRSFVDKFEELTTVVADVIVVNSNFTAETFKKTFKSLHSRELKVLYPVPNFDNLYFVLVSTGKVIFLSINRYERKKNISLSLRSLGDIRPNDVQLVHVGGYDSRVKENVEHYRELFDLISEQVTLLRSCTSDVKALLIAASHAVIYTPHREHFGIVPIEAMFLWRPVIALNSGGPKETIIAGKTGFLCDCEPEDKTVRDISGYMARLVI
ncbi:unnamed protein product [Schistocephalus solidus]|uniref:Alpha-1,3/1,6-mannosyltransferase ALG2 n=1 Tax=Schistocephalus solidus TaxID=70667 RepID=A0A183SZD5_SCHSO|nr:unnamed protein product [Schistocephalus solidus]